MKAPGNGHPVLKSFFNFVPNQFMEQEEKVILVDEQDRPLGLMPKMEAHRKGVLHRAFSVFIFNDRGQLMLQRRALSKYHSPGLWTNTVCSHQRQGEDSVSAGKRRLYEEMGFTAGLREIFSFIYRAELENGLVEHELDHVLIGRYNGEARPNPREAADYKWVYLSELMDDMAHHPENYTAWFKIIFEKSFSVLLNEAGKMFAAQPLKFRPYFVEKIWGNQRLRNILGKQTPYEHTGESWEISAVPGKESLVEDGIFKGFHIGQLWQWLDEDFWTDWKKRYRDFPLLIKFIDADDDLSVQVHPDDAMARRLHNSFGKNEAWYIMFAEPGARLYLGFREGMDEPTYLAKWKEGAWEEILRTVEVKPGDMFYIPAGTVHAIGKGILLAEVQQTSDITYRIYDWNRPGLDGKPRPLHTDLAREAVRFDLRPRRHKEPVLQTPYFVIKKEQWTEATKISTRQPLIVQNTGKGAFDVNGQSLSKGRTFLLWPGDYEIGITEPGEVLLTSLPTTV